MHFTRYLSLAAAAASTASAQVKGFNYGSTNPNGSGKTQQDFQNEFSTAANLVGGSGFTSARLYTMVQAGTANSAILAIPAAIATKTSLLLGLWGSAGQDAFNNELLAVQDAISKYGQAFADLVVGISVGSEDLYRITPTGIANQAGIGAGPDTLVSYISQLRKTVAGGILGNKPIGHVDTWTAYVNSSNNALISACDFLGVDAYPYFETTTANSIENGNTRFFAAYDATVAVAQGKPVWVTETGWPISGPQAGQATASVANSKAYWDSVGCALFGKTNTWWYTLFDGTPSPSFGITGSSLSTTPVFDLTCPAPGSSSTAAQSSTTAQTSTQQTGSATASTSTSTTASSQSVGSSVSATATPPINGGSPGASQFIGSSSTTLVTSSGTASGSSSGSTGTVRTSGTNTATGGVATASVSAAISDKAMPAFLTVVFGLLAQLF